MIAAEVQPVLLPVAFRLALVCRSLFSSDVHVHDHLSNCMCSGVVMCMCNLCGMLDQAPCACSSAVMHNLCMCSVNCIRHGLVLLVQRLLRIIKR